MFPRTYFAGTYFAPLYWPQATYVPPPPTNIVATIELFGAVTQQVEMTGQVQRTIFLTGGIE